MKKSSLVLVIILLAASIIFTEDKTDAWYSYGKPGDWPIHRGLALLSLDRVMRSDAFKDLKWRQKFDMIIIGANAPDRNKNWLTHEATFRIENTLCASVKAKKSSEALKRLAIGFHYLGDNGDATAGSYKNELLEIAYKMLYTRSDTYKDPKYKFRWGFKNGSRWRDITFIYDQNVKKIPNVNILVEELRKMARYRGERLRNAYRQHNLYLVREEFMHTFGYIRACQNRLLDFYDEELKNGDFGKCPAKKTEDERTVDCSTTTKSGRDKPETIRVKVGRTPGTVKFSYEMYKVKDRMIVSYGGQTLYDTGCVSGRKTVELYLPGFSDYVTVSVEPACERKGTEWNFRLECPTQTR